MVAASLTGEIRWWLVLGGLAHLFTEYFTPLFAERQTIP
jgi:hypothetical protein